MNPTPSPTQWLPAVAAAATLIAALVALFKEDIVKRWRCPNLSLRLSLASPDSVQMPVVVTYRYLGPVENLYATPPPGVLVPTIEKEGRWNGNCYLFRLWVTNTGHLAERVQVYIDSIRRQMGDNRAELVTDFIPMNLRWADSDPNKPLIFEAINPAMGRYCDFACVSPPSNPTEVRREGMAEGEATFNLQTQVTPSTLGNRLKPGKYTIKLVVAASNSKPKAFTVALDWSGRYMEDPARMFGEAVKLTVTEG